MISDWGKDFANGGRLCEVQSLISDSRKHLWVVNHFLPGDLAFAVSDLGRVSPAAYSFPLNNPFSSFFTRSVNSFNSSRKRGKRPT